MFSITPRTFLIGVCVVAAIVIFSAFAYTRVWGFISGPGLAVETPASSAAVTDPILAVEGYAPRATEITVNGAIVFLTESGTFRDYVALSDGYNVVTITAADRFGTTETVRRVVIYSPRER